MFIDTGSDSCAYATVHGRRGGGEREREGGGEDRNGVADDDDDPVVVPRLTYLQRNPMINCQG